MSKPTTEAVAPPSSDEQVLELRQQGKSFAGIARTLKLDDPRAAWLAYNRALRIHPPQRQAELRRSEVARLNTLTESIKSRTDLTEEELTKRLGSVERMRARILAK